MAIPTQPLPYDLDALEPHLSRETLEYHHGKHYAGYVRKLNDAIDGTELAELTLTDIVLRSNDAKVFNNAAQAWNHEFYFAALSPQPTPRASGPLGDAIDRKFGSFEDMCKAFSAAAAGQFGSGWAWLVLDADRELDIVTTANADNPMTAGTIPLLTCDVWEHAYYLDYRNERNRYLDGFLELVDWKVVADHFAQANAQRAA